MLHTNSQADVDHSTAPAPTTPNRAPATPPLVTEPNDRQKLQPLPAPLTPSRRVDLRTVVMDGLPETTAVETLDVRELKGIGATFTPNMAQALPFRGLEYKPEGEFDAVYQIIAGPLLHDPRIVGRLKTITFVPAYAWSTCEIVLAPFKGTKFGMRVLHCLRSLQPEFPNVKVFVEWNESRKRHLVQSMAMTSQERDLISKVAWPTRDQVLDALSMTAFDSLDDLTAANDEIRALLNSREVE